MSVSKFAIVFIHGLGDSGAGWSHLKHQLTFKNVDYTFPNSPSTPVACNGFAVMPSWFDIEDIPLTKNEPDSPKYLDESIKIIHDVLDGIILNTGIPAERIVLGGFSQGGALSLIAGATYKNKLCSVISLSGWLLRKESTVASYSSGGDKGSVPVFLGHGDNDNVVLTSLGVEARDRITKGRVGGGGEVGWSLAKNTAHSTDDKEIRDLKAFLVKQGVN